MFSRLRSPVRGAPLREFSFHPLLLRLDLPDHARLSFHVHPPFLTACPDLILPARCQEWNSLLVRMGPSTEVPGPTGHSSYGSWLSKYFSSETNARHASRYGIS